MRFYLVLILLAFMLPLTDAFAQPANDNCATAGVLCANTTQNASNIGATTEIGAGLADGAAATGTFCFDVENTVWFSFTTNNAGGLATVSISNINCLAQPGMGSQLQAVIISAATPCDGGTYTEVSNCELGSAGPIGLIAAGLAPNTTYYVVIDGALNGNSTIAAQCDFQIEVTGPAVDVTITTAVIDETCMNADGQIDVTAVDGAPAPYQYSLNGGAFQAGSTFSNLSAGSYTVTVQDANGCEHTETVVVDLVGGITSAQANPTDATACNATDGSIQVTGVTGGTAPYTYSLNGAPAQAGSTFNNLPPGIYDITVFDAQGCPYSLDDIEIEDQTDPWDVPYTVTVSQCGQDDGSIDALVNAGGAPPFSYSLNGAAGQANGQFNNLAPGVYTVTVTDDNGCEYVINNIIVQETPPDITPEVVVSIVPNPSCVGDPITVSAIPSPPGVNGNYEFFVNGASVQNGAQTTYAGTVNDGDVVSIIMTTTDPCHTTNTATSNNITVTVLQETTPTITITASETIICQGDQVVFTTQHNCQGDATFDFMVDGAVVQSTNIDTFVTSSLSNGSQVSVTMNCSDPCANPSTATSNTETITVTEVNADAGPGATISQGESYQLDGSGNGTFVWTPSQSLNSNTVEDPTASPNETTTYILTVTNGDCVDFDEVTVVVNQPVFPFNTFTPNGDGINDTWEIRLIENYPDARVNVYSRWGQKVFSSSGYSTPWDGTNRGLAIPAATYYYVIELDPGNPQLEEVTGSITIIK